MTRAGTTNALSRPLFDPDPDWMRRGACKGQDTEVWFASDTTEAKSVCRRCPVIADCLSWALANALDHGVWGGLDRKERKALKRRARGVCGNGHEQTPSSTYPGGKCRLCDDWSHEERQLAAGVVLVPCSCGRRIAPRKNHVPYHVDRTTGQRCPGTGVRAEVKV